MQRGGAVRCHLFTVLCGVYGGRAEITVPGNISQQPGIQSCAVWHLSTDCWPAVSGVAHPRYLLPGSERSINQTSFMKLRKVTLEHQSHFANGNLNKGIKEIFFFKL